MTQEIYNQTRNYLKQNRQVIEQAEKYITGSIFDVLNNIKNRIKNDYDAASSLRPFWKNYPPDDRGRQPRGDQIPWIEVGEHSVGDNLIKELSIRGNIEFPGLPAGPDIRYIVTDPNISKMSNGHLDGYWSFLDIKSVGPRDNFPHTVMSHNQISGDGKWDTFSGGILNSVMTATGKRTSHEFHCSLSPIYILNNGKKYISYTSFLKPIYGMGHETKFEQNLEGITFGCIPNGLLLTGNDGYLSTHPSLLFPGKDDKSKNPKKLRARVDFKILTQIASWRMKNISF